jgi:hypothetical protein
LKEYRSLGSDQISAELIQAWGETLRSEIHKFINFIWIKEELPDQWKESIIAPIYKKCDKIDSSIGGTADSGWWISVLQWLDASLRA